MTAYVDRLTKLELLSKLEYATARTDVLGDEGVTKYGVVTIPAKMDADGNIDVAKRTKLVKATLVADVVQFRRRFARYVGKVLSELLATGATEDIVQAFRLSCALFLARLGVGAASFSFGGRDAASDTARYELFFRPSAESPVSDSVAAYRGNEMPIIVHWDAVGSEECIMPFFTAGMDLTLPSTVAVAAGGAITSIDSGGSLVAKKTDGVHEWDGFVDLLEKFEQLFEEIVDGPVSPNETQVGIDRMITPPMLEKLVALGVHFPCGETAGSSDKERANALFASFDEDFDADTHHKGHGFAGQMKDTKLLLPEFVTACAYATPSSGNPIHGDTFTLNQLQLVRNSFENYFDAVAGGGSSSCKIETIEERWLDLPTHGLTLPPDSFPPHDMFDEMEQHSEHEAGATPGWVEIHLFEMYIAFFQNPGALHHE